MIEEFDDDFNAEGTAFLYSFLGDVEKSLSGSVVRTVSSSSGASMSSGPMALQDRQRAERAPPPRHPALSYRAPLRSRLR